MDRPEPETSSTTSTELAFERTRLAYENTMMAWIRTATSLITFGFSVYKFFQLEMPGRESRISFLGPRAFALALIGVGVLSLLLGAIGHRQSMNMMRKRYAAMPRSMSTMVAVFVAGLGLFALLAVILRG
jgi:inner membrane protein YidH